MKLRPTPHLRHLLISLACLTLLFAVTAPGQNAGNEGWRDLVSGNDFQGWVKRGGKATYAIENGEVVGSCVLNTENTFLCTEKDYGDFILEYEFKVDPRLNSGVQIRSECFPEKKEITWEGKKISIPAGRVHGYQVEIDPDVPLRRMWSAGIYDEARRGWLFPNDGPRGPQAQAFSEQGRRIFKPGDWNHVRVEAIGDHLKTWLNGIPCADLTDSLTPKGLIGLQVHSIRDDHSKVGAQVRWRNLRLKEVNDGKADIFLPDRLRCDLAVDPLGVDVPTPRLSWQIEASRHARVQTAYQILAASSRKLLANGQGDLWDTGKLRSGSTLQIPYAGRPLKSSQQVFWSVRAWDENDRASDWSAPATWTMGVLDEKDWQAKWIGSANTNAQSLMLRREFVIKPQLRRALASVCGLGHYELSVNGAKSGDDLLAPGWTEYAKTCLYDTRDLTAMLHAGTNAVGLILGNGMYRVPGGRYTKFKGSHGPLKAIAQLRLEYSDGSVEIIGTDAAWRVTGGPLTFSCVFGGEDYDPNLEPAGWNQPGFDVSQWQPASETDGPGGKLRGLSCAAPPIKAFETLTPVKTTVITNGVTVYDLGQNAPIIPRLHVQGPAGSMVRIIPAELVATNGRVDRVSCGGGQAYWQYTLAGGKEETWFPRFFYHGSRYLQVECIPAPGSAELPTVKRLEAVVVHSSSAPVGEFSCSNELFNRIYTLIRWAQRANMVSVLTDCPHRERLGWLEQYHLNGPSLRYNFDLAQLYTKGMNDMADSQLANGFVPNIAPEYVVFGKNKDDVSNAFRDSPEWGSAFILVPWQQYEFTGDTELLRRHYEAMKRYVAYLGSRSTNNIVSHGLGDWYDIGPKPPGYAQLTPRELTATAFHYYDTWVLAQTAGLLGKADEAKQLTAQAEQIREAYNLTFFNSTNRSYATGSQCANAISLVLGLVEETNRAAVLSAIVADVQSRGNAITAGDVGYRYLLRALAEGGRSDVVYAMNNQSEKPGYGYQLKMGATSLTEAWDAGRHSSQNHFMLGQIMEWFYHDLAGIQPDAGHPGFKHIVIRPAPVGDLQWVKATYDSPHGPVSSDWRRQQGNFELEVKLPPNTTAEVFVPGKNARMVEPDNMAAAREQSAAGATVFRVNSGHYTFQSDFSQP